jgi:hypothetical protein
MFKIGITDEEIINAGCKIDNLIYARYLLDSINKFYKKHFKIEELIKKFHVEYF